MAQRWGRAERFGGLVLVAVGDSVGGRIAGVAGAPTGLRLLATSFLAVGFTAGALAAADAALGINVGDLAAWTGQYPRLVMGLTRAYYHVTGPWSDPVVERISAPPDANAAAQDAARAALAP